MKNTKILNWFVAIRNLFQGVMPTVASKDNLYGPWTWKSNNITFFGGSLYKYVLKIGRKRITELMKLEGVGPVDNRPSTD